jgi:outer membrane protein
MKKTFFALALSVLFVPLSLYAAEEYTLDQLYLMALERAEKIKLSEEDLYISETGREKALSAILPKLSAFGSYTKYSEDKYASNGSLLQPDSSASWGLRLDQSFSLSGREITALKIAKDYIEKSRYDLQSAKEAYILGVASSYFDLLRSQKRLDIAKANVERLAKHRDAAAVRLKVGEVTKTALLRAEAELSGAKSEQIRAENTLALSKTVLARLAGISGQYSLKETDENAEILETLSSLKNTAIAERAEMKSLALQKKIAERQALYTKGSYYPSVSIEGVYARKDDRPISITLNKESVYGGVKLNFPFFEGGLRRAEVKEAEARVRQAELLYSDAEKSLNVEVENAYFDYITQKGILSSLKDQVAFASDNYNAVSRQFEFGLASSIDVMDANTLLVTAERQYSDASYNYRLSALTVRRSAGVLFKTVLKQTVSDK